MCSHGRVPRCENRTFGDPQVTADDHGEHRIYNVQVQLDSFSQTESHGEMVTDVGDALVVTTIGALGLD